MKVTVNRINAIQKSDEQSNKDDLSLLASCEVINHIASKHSSSYRLTAGAKRMLILKRLDNCKSDRDFALLMRLLNDIDKADTDNNTDDKGVIFTWATSTDDNKEDS